VEYDDPALSSHDRHSRKCVICHHPDRVGIEEHFLNWRNTELIRQQYGLPDFRPIYRHARATGLLQQRRENLRFAAELVIEHADHVVPIAEGVLRANRVSARLDEKGRWVEPPSHVVVSSGGRIATPQFGPLPQISMTQVVLPPPIAPNANAPTQIPQPATPQHEVSQVEVPQPQTPTLDSAAPSQLGAVNHRHEEIPAPSAAILGEELHSNLIGHAAIKNRRNPMKLNGAFPF
jgi:hypothetical protein